ncbi:histidine kinase [Kribbella sandramycini]|uniref:histidine kinase n=1 Tax=Kribbella sandramycini TaxID=60450 RepID=A0A841SND0_9ACTN|nr:signal transduction histidine kinase [Kribbella sandramycini]
MESKPGILAALIEPGSSAAPGYGRRTPRDRVVDVACVVLALLIGLPVVGDRQPEPRFGQLPLWLSLPLCVAGALALLLRRRWPAGLALVMIVGSTAVPSLGGAGGLALFSVSVHRRPAVSLSIGAVAMASCMIQFWIYPIADAPNAYPIAVALTALACLALVAWGIVVRTRRQLMVSLSERAVRAERERIARDMHDALGHRLSLLSVHAGALEFRPDMPPEELARAAGVIRVSARESVEDLREIVGVLRSGDDGPRRGIAKLIAESRAAGMVIELVTSVEPAAVTDLTAYRIVQEGLTNARKHAPRQPVRLTLSGTPGAELAIELVNRVESGSGGPGSRVGLVGLAERVSPAGGRIEYGTADGEFRLAAWLPWRVLR